MEPERQKVIQRINSLNLPEKTNASIAQKISRMSDTDVLKMNKLVRQEARLQM
jgi:hypothetical protein